jgi:PKD repeat protein
VRPWTKPLLGVVLVSILLLSGVWMLAVANFGQTRTGPAQPGAIVPVAGAPFSFGVAGDFAFSSTAQAVMTSMGNSGLDFAIAAGDLSYGATSEQNWCDFFESKVGDGKVLLVVGNHDSGESGGGNINNFRQYCNFGIQATLTGDYGKEYYFDYPQVSPLARFIGSGCGVNHVIDGTGRWNCNVGDGHYNFVKNAIDSARTAGIPWVIVNTHKTCINSGDYGCEIGEALMDLMLTGSPVDLILQAHYHTYQRSKQLTCADDNNYRPECVSHADTPYVKGEGSVINIAGTGGQGLYNIVNNEDRNYFAVVHGAGMNGDSRGFTKFTINETAIDATFVRNGGTFQDDFAFSGPGGPPPPFAVDFTFSPANPIVGETVTFAATTSGGTPPATFAWTFGDGGTGSGNPVTHSYSAAGTYAVEVTATDSVGAVATKLKNVLVSAPPPPDFSLVANPSSVTFVAGGSANSVVSLVNQNGFSGTVSLSGSSSPIGVNTNCVPASISGSQTSTCTFTSTTPGSYTVTITGTSGSLVHTTAIAASVTPAGPTARFTYTPTIPEVNESVAFDASSSTDTDPSATLQARWDWEGDGQWDTPFSDSLTALHTFTTADTYPVKLEIQDSHGFSDTTSRAIVVLALATGDVGAPPGYGLVDPSRLVARGPIYIGNNAGFTAANGVRSGTGTLVDPYVISDWFIDGSLYTGAQAMIHVEGTDAYLVIENNKIVNLADPNHWEAIQLGHWPASISTQHVTIRHNHVENARHAYGIAVREGSRDVRVEANYVRLDANYEWVYGIATDRGVHDVTINGNYVDAYTSGNFHTTGIHLSDTHVDDVRRATGVVAIRNTIVNATGGSIVSASSFGTVVSWNLIYSDYPGPKSVSAGLPRGIDTAWNSDQSAVVGNVIHSMVSGILVGSDHGLIVSNMIYNVDYGIFVPDNGSMPGVSTYADTIYNTTTWNVANGTIRLPSNFAGTVVDLGAGILPTDMTSVLLVTHGAATRVDVSWSGQILNLSATIGGSVPFDTVETAASQSLRAGWTGSVTDLDLIAFSANRVSFRLESGADVLFDGAGFTPDMLYNLTRSNGGGTTIVLTVRSTPTGDLVFTIPSSVPSDYVLTPEAIRDTIAPVTTASVGGSSGMNGWHTSPVSLDLSATDDLSGVAAIHLRLDGGAWQVYTGPTTVQGEGSHTIEYYATDVAGNDETVRSVPVKIDTVKATTSAQLSGTLAGDGSYIDSVTVTLSATDATSGVQLIDYRINGGAWRTYTGGFPLGGNGTHTIDYATTDIAGNVEDTKSSVVRISGASHAAPTTTADIVGTFGQNEWYISTVEVTLTATSPSGALTSIAYSLDGLTWTTYSGRFTVPEGRYTVRWQAWDVAGYFEPVKTREIAVDLTNPTVEGMMPSGPVTTADVTISWTASDSPSGIARYEVSVDGGPFVSVGLETQITRHFSDGAHRVQVRAIDHAGHESVSSTDFTVAPSGVSLPGPLQAIPLYFPAMGLGLLLFSFLLIRRRHRKERAQDESEQSDSELDDAEQYDSDEN